MADDTLWNHITGAKSKRPGLQPDAPSQQPMRAGIKPADRKAPSSDQKRVRRQMSKSADASTATKESTMSEQHTEADLLAKMAGATTLSEQSYWGERLNEFRDTRRDAIAAESSLDFEAMGGDLSPTYVLEPMTAASLGSSAGGLDWLADVQPEVHDDQKIATTMQAEATLWYEGLWDLVKADPEEFSIQSRNAARRTAAQFGQQADGAASVFEAKVAHLHKKAFDETQPGPYAIPNGSKLPNPDSKDTFDGIVNGENGETGDPKSKDLDSPSLNEGSTPEGDKAEGIESPIADDDGAKYVKDTSQGTTYTDPLPTGGKGASLHTADGKMEKCPECGATWTGGLPEHKGICPKCGHNAETGNTPKVRPDGSPNSKSSGLSFFEAIRQAFADTADPKTDTSDAPSLAEGDQPEGDKGSAQMDNPPGANDASTWGGDPDPLNTGGTDGTNASSGSPIAGTPTHASKVAGEYAGGSPKAGDTATCHKDGGKIQFFDGQWMHLKGTGSDHNDVHPATPKEKADKEKTSSLSSLGQRIAREAQTDNVRTFGTAVSRMASLDEKVAGFTGHDILGMVLASGDISDEVRQVLAGYPSNAEAEAAAGNMNESRNKSPKCSVCGEAIAQDLAGEKNRGWHHNTGEKHDHEAKPGGGSKESMLPFSREAADSFPLGARCSECGHTYDMHGGAKGCDQCISLEKPNAGHRFVEKETKESSLQTEAGTSGPMDRSVIFTLLLHYYPGFGQMDTREGEKITTDFTNAWAADRDYTDMAKFVQDRIAQQGHTGSLQTEAGTVEVSDLPECDIHKFEKGQSGVPAKYDAPTKIGPWANMCEECYSEYGTGNEALKTTFVQKQASEGGTCYSCNGTGKDRGFTCEDCNGSGVDNTPYGTGGDHCPHCGTDWRQPHREGCPRLSGRFASLQTEAEQKAKPGEIENLDSGAYQRSKCQNCGDTIRRKSGMSGRWQHAKTNSPYCGEAPSF